ncbi:MAG: RluA family pseudouridine synthase [Desulfobacteraceae bacterium]|nr:MAG: RluA family pseudouridine synthase [Desulfobacteraceae bacterium]
MVSPVPESRLDVFLTSQITDLTRNRAQALIRAGRVRVNDCSDLKAGYRLKTGDRVSIFIPPARSLALEPESIDLSILHEDRALVIINKPPGLVVHPAPGHATGTLVHGLLQHCRDLSGIGGVLRPGIVHRLDKDTSGLIVVAKHDRAHLFLSRQFASGQVFKKYTALAHGIPKSRSGKIDLPIGRHPKKRKEMSIRLDNGRPALTFWEKTESFGDDFSLILVTPKTGRTHQIRVHLAHLGHPIAGDPVYGYKKNWWKKHSETRSGALPEIRRQMLHAGTLGFKHPDSDDYCEFSAPLPADMKEVIAALRRWS